MHQNSNGQSPSVPPGDASHPLNTLFCSTSRAAQIKNSNEVSTRLSLHRSQSRAVDMRPHAAVPRTATSPVWLAAAVSPVLVRLSSSQQTGTIISLWDGCRSRNPPPPEGRKTPLLPQSPEAALSGPCLGTVSSSRADFSYQVRQPDGEHLSSGGVPCVCADCYSLSVR